MGMIYGEGRKCNDAGKKGDCCKSQGFKEAKKKGMEFGPQEARGGSQTDNGTDSDAGQCKEGWTRKLGGKQAAFAAVGARSGFLLNDLLT